MRDYVLKAEDRVMVKLSYHPELMLLTVLGKDDLGLWLDSYDAQKMIEAIPVLGFDKKPFEHDWSGYRPTLYIPFAHIDFLLKIEKGS